MKAAVLFDTPGELLIEEVTPAAPQAREVQVRVAATGLCHSDLHHIENPTTIVTPTVLGHEAAGVVEAVGSDVDYVAAGDHVVTVPRGFCGHCEWCLGGRPTLCEQVGLSRPIDGPGRLVLAGGRACSQLAGIGSFAETMLVHENKLVKIDPDIPLDRAALVSCGVVTGVGAVLRTARVPVGATVAVIGCGGVGLNAIQGAVLAGASQIIAIDIDDSKLALAHVFGATGGINSLSQDVEAELDKLLPGQGGVEYSFEALGRRETIELSFRILRAGGTATVIGYFDGTVELRGRGFLFERRIQGSLLGSSNVRKEIPLLLRTYQEGRLKLDELVSRRLPLGQINEGFQAMAAGQVARAVVTFE